MQHPTLKPILIIDDEEMILGLMSKALAKKGYPTDTANSGEEGIGKVLSGEYSLVITDIQMPGIQGTDVVARIKDTEKRYIPVIGMSGTPWRLKEGLFDAVLSKPCSLQNLFASIEQILFSSPQCTDPQLSL
ncbi:MAG: response regulator [Desulfobacteraceae bacterium]